MNWSKAINAVLKGIEVGIPIAETILGPKAGLQKAEIVTGQAQAIMDTLLTPEASADPQVQAAIRAKIAADVALRNLLQTHEPSPSTIP